MECFIIGGGPSVTEDQINAIKKWQHKTNGQVWAVNKVFMEIPWADYMFSRDTRFLKEFERYLEHCPMQVVVGNSTFTPPYAKQVPTETNNSGSSCIEAAARLGATTIYLVGADGHHKGGTHWHGGYSGIKACVNSPKPQRYNEYYERAMEIVGDINVYNCSPGTAITAVPTMDFEEAINGKP